MFSEMSIHGGKYRDVILPMTVIRRLDCLLEDKKDEVLAMKKTLDEAGIVNQDGSLRKVAGQAFYNTSRFTLKTLMDNPKQLLANFRDYLDGFSPNVQEIVEKFDFRNQLQKLDNADALGHLIQKFVDPEINLSPNPVFDGNGKVKLPGLDNHDMGSIFEELIRRFNEENNEEAGEHWTPRDVVRLMAHLVFLPVADLIKDSTYLVYDPACGTGGMLTVAEEVLADLSKKEGKKARIHLYGQEINAETYAICKADLLLKGQGRQADHIRFGSTLSSDAFTSDEFHFMLANPPFGKSWKTDLDRLCGGNKKDMLDPRFVLSHGGDDEFSLVSRSSDGQLMFLVNMLSKMKPPEDTPFGSRLAIVHNGSSLFTGDAGQGESNIRRWIIENDWLETIIALPLHMFYNTGIATYVWVLTNKKPEHRRGKVQLINAAEWFVKLRKKPGSKELPPVPKAYRPNLRCVPEVRGNGAVQDFSERNLRVLENHGRTAASAQFPVYARAPRKTQVRPIAGTVHGTSVQTIRRTHLPRFRERPTQNRSVSGQSPQTSRRKTKVAFIESRYLDQATRASQRQRGNRQTGERRAVYGLQPFCQESSAGMQGERP